MFKMKFKFIFIAFFTSLLFLFVNGRDTNKKTTEKFYSNDYEVHFVVHKTKKAKKENFLERKMKRIQKKVTKLIDKYDKGDNNKILNGILVISIIFLLAYVLGWFSLLSSGIVLNSVFKEVGTHLIFLLLAVIIFQVTIRAFKKKKNQHNG